MILHGSGDVSSDDWEPAETEIRNRIRERGRISFAEFMDLALYHLEGGYYSVGQPVGAAGDFYTSPAAHPAFGALLAVQMERCWELMSRPSPFYVVEMGSGDGLLARALLNYATRPSSDFAFALDYIALDRRHSAVADSANTPPPQRVLADGAPLAGVHGCFISNELIDAFPVHRFRIVDGVVRELYVVVAASGELMEEAGEPSTPRLAERLAKLGHALPDGYTGEVNLTMSDWARDVSAALDRGFVVTIDYGYSARELYAPTRTQGTLQTYLRHTESGSPFTRIGRQDITAHVDFTALARDGAAVGLRPLGVASQAEYLHGLGAGRMIDELRRIPMPAYDRDANLMAMRGLVDPTRLGGFKVLVQSKGVEVSDVAELMPSPTRLDGMEPPMLDSLHTPLYEGKYPQREFKLESLWPFGDPDDEEGSERAPQGRG